MVNSYRYKGKSDEGWKKGQRKGTSAFVERRLSFKLRCTGISHKKHFSADFFNFFPSLSTISQRSFLE
jgi:hypothetical protein